MAASDSLPYEWLPAQPPQQKSKSKVLLGTLGCIFLLIVIAVVLGVTLSVNHPKWHGCEEDYWKQECRLKRGYDEYNNFLAHAGLLLPSVIHRTIGADELGEGRILMLGDIHGCRDEFLMLLKKAKFKQGEDDLILAGDLVDKGPYSVEVIQEARKLGALSVRGNHDDTGLAAYEDHLRGREVKEKHQWVKDLSEMDAQWLYNLPWSISLPSHNIVIVHAGMVPKVPLEKQLLVDLNHMREVGPGDDTKYRGIEAKPDEGQGKAWAKVWDGPQHVVFGHDHKKGLQEEAFATGIDTGVVHGLYLTGLMLPGVKDFNLMNASAIFRQPNLVAALGGKYVKVKAKKNYAKLGQSP